MSYDNILSIFPSNPPLFRGKGIPKHTLPERCNNVINFPSIFNKGSYVFVTTLYKTTLFLSILSHNKSQKFSNG